MDKLKKTLRTKIYSVKTKKEQNEEGIGSEEERIQRRLFIQIVFWKLNTYTYHAEYTII